MTINERVERRLIGATQVVQPKTILRWQRAGFTTFWRWKSRYGPHGRCPYRVHKPLLLRESKRGRLPPVESRNCSPRNRRHGRPRDILLTPQMRRVNNIRLGADAGNPLSRSRNSRADGDGCIGFACRCRGDVLNGMTVRTVGSEPRRGSLSDRVLKPLHPSNAGDGSLRSRL